MQPPVLVLRPVRVRSVRSAAQPADPQRHRSADGGRGSWDGSGHGTGRSTAAGPDGPARRGQPGAQRYFLISNAHENSQLYSISNLKKNKKTKHFQTVSLLFKMEIKVV